MEFAGVMGKAAGGRGKAKVLEWLLAHPDAECTTREIARLAGVSHPTASKALQECSRQNLVSLRRVGKSYLWKANRGSYLYMELARGTDALGSLIKDIRNALPAGCEAYLYGSVLKATEEASSDIDLLVVAKDKPAAEAAVGKLASALLRKYGNPLSAMVVTASGAGGPAAKMAIKGGRRIK